MLVGCQCGGLASGQRYEGRSGPRRQAFANRLSSVKSAQRRPRVGSSTSDTTSETRSMPAFRSVVSVLVSFVVRSFSTNSRPALRAAACGGRPRAGRATAATEAPPHPHAGWSRRYAPASAGHANAFGTYSGTICADNSKKSTKRIAKPTSAQNRMRRRLSLAALRYEAKAQTGRHRFLVWRQQASSFLGPRVSDLQLLGQSYLAVQNVSHEARVVVPRTAGR
jgi:hypothetical protein